MGLKAREYVQTEKESFLLETVDGKVGVIPYGIDMLDDAYIMGQKPTAPSIFVWQGAGGSRKTTIQLNLIIAQQTCGTLPASLKTNIYTLESGISVEGYFLRLRLILAAKIMLYAYYYERNGRPASEYTGYLFDYQKGRDAKEYYNQITSYAIPKKRMVDYVREAIYVGSSGKEYPLFTIRTDYVEKMYNNLGVGFSLPQASAWVCAGRLMEGWNIEVFGASEHPDMAKAKIRSTNTVLEQTLVDHWWQSVEEAANAEEPHKVQIVFDYLHAVMLENGISDHYTKQRQMTPHIEAIVKESRALFTVLAQEGSTRQGQDEVYGASGGDILHNASHQNFRVSYRKNEDIYSMILHAALKSRRGHHPDLLLQIEPNSGLILPWAEEYVK